MVNDSLSTYIKNLLQYSEVQLLLFLKKLSYDVQAVDWDLLCRIEIKQSCNYLFVVLID